MDIPAWAHHSGSVGEKLRHIAAGAASSETDIKAD